MSRIIRLEIALLPSLLLCTVFDFTGLIIFGENNIYPGLQNGQNVVDYNVISNLNFNCFLGNLLFLQTILVSVYGSNTPLWSLSNEFWYYIIFPLLVMPFMKGKNKIINLLVLFITLLVVVRDKLLGFLIWLLGVAIALTLKIKIHRFFIRQIIVVLSVLIMLLCLITSKIQVLSNYSDYMIGFGTSFLVYSVIQTDQDDKDKLSKPGKITKFYICLARTFANFSYSLYLLHLPLLIFISCFFVRTNRWQRNFKNFLISCIVSASVLFYSYSVARVTEFKTNDVRKFFFNKIKLINQ